MLSLDTLEHWKRHRPALLGFLLVLVGFGFGYFTRGGATAPAHETRHTRHAVRAEGPRAVAMHWVSERPNTTIVVVQEGRARDFGPAVGPTSRPPLHTHAPSLMLGLLALSLLPVAVWGALAWNRRSQTQPAAASEFERDDFVPRRDD